MIALFIYTKRINIHIYYVFGAYCKIIYKALMIFERESKKF